MRASSAIVACLVLLNALMLVAPTSRADAHSYYVQSETMNRGTSDNAVGNLQGADGALNVMTETGTLHSPGAWLKPNGNAAPNNFLAKTICSASHFTCVNDDPVHDANTTYVVGAAGQVNKHENYTTTDWAISATIINSVTQFTWVRDNVSGGGPGLGIDYQLWIEDGTTQCPSSSGNTLSGVFVNLTVVNPLACSGGSWTVAKVNALTQQHQKGGNLALDDFTITSVGVVVAYTDTFYIDAVFNFVGVQGTNTQVNYVCTTTNAANALVGPGGAVVTCDGTQHAFAVADGTQSLEFTGASAPSVPEATAGAWSFDYLTITTQTAPPPPPGENPLDLACTASGILRIHVDCIASLQAIIGVMIVSAQWSVDGTDYGVTPGVDESTPVWHVSYARLEFDTWSVARSSRNVSVVATFNTPETGSASRIVVLPDSTWVVVLVFVGIVFVVLLALVTHHRRGAPARKQREEREENAGKPNWRQEVIKGFAVLVLVACLMSGGARAPADPSTPHSYLALTVDPGPHRTFDVISLHIASELLVERNVSGNVTHELVANWDVIDLTVEDRRTNTTILHEGLVIGGNGTVDMFVDPAWTDTQLRITAVDYTASLVAQLDVRTEMSQSYYAFVLWQQVVVPAQKAAQDVHDELQTVWAILAFVSTILFGLGGVLYLATFLKREHQVARDQGTVSLWDRLYRRLWPWGFREYQLEQWLDPARSWDSETAQAFIADLNSGPIAELERHRDWLDLQIGRLKARSGQPVEPPPGGLANGESTSSIPAVSSISMEKTKEAGA